MTATADPQAQNKSLVIEPPLGAAFPGSPLTGAAPDPALMPAVMVSIISPEGGENPAAPTAASAPLPEPILDLPAVSVLAKAPELIRAYDKFIQERPADQKLISFEEFIRLRAHEEMRESLKDGLERFLQPFLFDVGSEQKMKRLLRDDFFQRFITSAGELAERSSWDFAEIIQRSTNLEDVRKTPTVVRARRVRDAAFGRLDAILLSFGKTPEQIQRLEEDLQRTLAGMHGAHSPDAVLREAVAEELNGTVNTTQLVTTLSVAEQDAGRRLYSMRQQQKALLQAKNAAFLKMKDYLSGLVTLPESMLNYAFSKCYGGDIDFSLEKTAVLRVQEAIRPKIARALEVLGMLSGAVEQQLDEQGNQETAKVEEQRQLALNKIYELERVEYEALGYQAMGFGVVCLLVAWLVGDLSTGGDNRVIGFRVLAFIAGVIFIAWGLSTLMFDQMRSNKSDT